MLSRQRLLLRYALPLLMGLGLGLLLLRPSPPATLVHTTTQLHMGTLVSISTWNTTTDIEERAVTRAFAEIARIEQRMSLHRPDSEVAKINAVSRETSTAISAELATLLRLGETISHHSAGAFAMDLEPLTRLWGFSGESQPSIPPDEKSLHAWLSSYPKKGGIVVIESTADQFFIRLKSNSVGLDLGGIAKGYAIDRAVEIMRQEGAINAMVNAGGDLRILGSKGGEPWRIGLQNPRQPENVVAISKLSGDRAMVTSGDYERFFLHEGIRYHHILDPRTGKPARSLFSSVSVQAPQAMLADALSTAIFVLGREKGLALLQKFPACEALLITESGEQIRTPGFIGEWLVTP